uniref:Uncharacterized protein n=1 Tax=Anguilla anguilla TaxID=7936 RepID=A0A0E9RSD3_ANGAN
MNTVAALICCLVNNKGSEAQDRNARLTLNLDR